VEGSDGKWVFGAVMGVIGVLGLFMASRAADQTFYWTGLVFFLFGVIAVFILIGRAYGPPRQRRHGGEEEEETRS
jgi:hypothetical protein